MEDYYFNKAMSFDVLGLDYVPPKEKE